MTKKQKKMLIRIIIAAVLMIILHFLPQFVQIGNIPLFLLWLVPYGIIGYDILKKAWKGILNRQPEESLEGHPEPPGVRRKLPHGRGDAGCAGHRPAEDRRL